MTFTDVINLKNSNDKIIEIESKVIKVEDFKMKVRKVTLKVTNYGTIPEGKQGAGNKAWTFIDEIIVN